MQVLKVSKGHLDKITHHVNKNKVFLYVKSTCPYCKGAKRLLEGGEVQYKEYAIDVEKNGDLVKSALIVLTGQRTVPNIFINGEHIGGFDNLKERYDSGELIKMLNDANVSHNFKDIL